MKIENSIAFERTVIFLIAAVQFVNILEFMMVMPLGPDFAKDLDIPMSHLGYIGGSYTGAASIAGLLSSTFIEKFDRRKALAFAICGLVISTIIGGLSINFEMLLGARILAGMFGGPATSLALAIVADVIPPTRRGKAMATVMMSFSLASIFGVPAGLELARLGSWRIPFFAVAMLGTCISLAALLKLPPMRAHLDSISKSSNIISDSFALLRRPTVIVSYIMTATVMLALFSLVPNIAPYVLENLKYPRERLGLLYMCGGLASFLLMRPIGLITDKIGSFKVALFGTIIFVSIVYIMFVAPPHNASVLIMFTVFMTTAGLRNIPYTSLTSQVPKPNERARFMALQSSIQHLSSALGAFMSSQILSETIDHNLLGMDTLGKMSMLFALVLPVGLFYIQRNLNQDSSA
ncbi:MAG: MFS transporter [Bdellovibrionota bacterium]